jgi:hypothetical protein
MRTKEQVAERFIQDNEQKYLKLSGAGKGWKRTVAADLVRKFPDLFTNIEVARRVVRKITGAAGKNNSKSVRYEISSNKKYSEFNWRDPISHLKGLKQVYDKGKSSQDLASWKIKGPKEICVVVLGDLHMGSWATDYDQLMKITDELVNTPNLYAILVGDLLQMSIKLRGVLEVSDNALPPKWQLAFLESWLNEVKHKIICSTWDNHSVMREENATGYSRYADIFGRVTIYHDNIGHTDIHVNDQVYKVAAAHFFRGRTMYNPCHGQMRYMRMTSNDREICIAGDSHESGMLQYNEGGKFRTAINCGSIQNGGYGKRFFSLINNPDFPCFALSGKEHLITPYYSVKQWVQR